MCLTENGALEFAFAYSPKYIYIYTTYIQCNYVWWDNLESSIRSTHIILNLVSTFL